MKNIILNTLVMLLLTLTARAQSYSIDWYKVSGGGGTGTNGQYSLSGTIGQHDADGPMTGGTYSLTGGFWAIYAVQSPGAPTLTITRTATYTVVMSWPSPSTGFALQQTSTLSPANWVNVVQMPTDDGTTKSLVINPPVGNLFFRLKK